MLSNLNTAIRLSDRWDGGMDVENKILLNDIPTTLRLCMVCVIIVSVLRGSGCRVWARRGGFQLNGGLLKISTDWCVVNVYILNVYVMLRAPYRRYAH